MLLFSDLHLKEDTEALAFQILESIYELALQDSDRWVVFAGDWWQLRYRVSVRLLNRVREMLWAWTTRGIRLDMIPGNHDQVTTAGDNALECLSDIPGVTVHSDAEVTEDILWLPYRKDPEIIQEWLTRIWDKKHFMIVGHWGVQGTTMNSGRQDQEGLRVGDLSDRILVLGHYHQHQTIGPMAIYCGSPYQTSFGEAGNQCGVLQFDLAKKSWRQIILDDVRAPRHVVLTWDVNQPPPQPPDWLEWYDKVRVDVVGSHVALMDAKAQKQLKEAGLEQAMVQVVASTPKREHRFEPQSGETLAELGKRFVEERTAGDAESQAMKGGLLGKLAEWTELGR